MKGPVAAAARRVWGHAPPGKLKLDACMEIGFEVLLGKEANFDCYTSTLQGSESQIECLM